MRRHRAEPKKLLDLDKPNSKILSATPTPGALSTCPSSGPLRDVFAAYRSPGADGTPSVHGGSAAS